MTTVTVTTTGAGSFTIPSGVSSITFEAWGSGGNGGGGTGTGGGGGGGGYISASISVTTGDVIFYNVPAGGIGDSGTNGAWFQKTTNSATNAWQARNGTPGSTAGTGPGGPTTNGTVGTLISAFAGGDGAAPQGGGGSRAGSGGGGCAGKDGVGGGGTAGAGGTQGAGGVGDNGSGGAAGTANVEGGGGGNGGVSTGNGQNAGAPGGGGGGTGKTGTTPGTGARGQIRYTYTVSGPSLGISAETDTALNRGTALGLGIPAETDTALARTAVVLKPLGISTETDTALIRSPALGVNRSAETETALALSLGTISIPVGLSTEADSTLTRTGVLIKTAGISTETDTVLASALASPAGLSTETDTALQLSTPGVSVSPSLETDTALGLSLVIQIGIPPAGPTLLKNPFINDLSSWTASANAALSIVNGRLHIVTNDGAAAYAYQQISTPASSTPHKLDFDVLALGGANANLFSGVNPGSSEFLFSTSWTSGSHSLTFNGVNGAYISLITAASPIGSYTEWDNIILRESGVIETDTALALSRQLNVGISTEADIAFGLTPSLGFTAAVEADTPLALSALWIKSLGLSTEVDSVLALPYTVTGPVGVCAEAETAFGLTFRLLSSVGLSTETDTSLTLPHSITCVEFDSCLALSRRAFAKGLNRPSIDLTWLAFVKPEVNMDVPKPETFHLDDPRPPVNDSSRFA